MHIGGLLVLLSLLPGLSAARGHTVLVEAESFGKLGGWVVDQQFMDQMGSPYLLAHGLGEPVEDAVTTVTFGAMGKYHVWVRTCDWVAPWNAPGAPGKFQVLVDGKPLKVIFGMQGAEWHWQDGGNIEIEKEKSVVALHDLMGFEGRCDAILFTTDEKLVPPNKGEQMAKFRRELLGLPKEPSDGGSYDLVVVGGGIAGTCTSLSAARLGVKVALIQDRPVLGGNNSSEVRVWLAGKTNYEPYPRIGDVVKELEPAKRAHYGPDNTAEIYEDRKRIDLVRAERNIELFLSYRANEVETKANKITAVIAQHIVTGQRVRFRGRYFADCTGDGSVGHLAGADYDITLHGHMGRCNVWNTLDTGEPVSFPHCPWALDLSDKSFPTKLRDLGCWFWESGFYHDPFEKSEYIRDWNFRAMYGAWDAMKNVRGMYPNHKLNWAAYISGKRESRRLLGDVILTQEDILNSVAYEDAFVPSTWIIDLHLPHPDYDDGFEKDAFISEAHFTDYPEPYWVPYRCLYSRNIQNLLMAGRDISVTHEALGAVRVMRTCGMMGEIVGMAASLCKKHNTTPRSVHENHLAELKELARRGAGKDDLPEESMSGASTTAGCSAETTERAGTHANILPQRNVLQICGGHQGPVIKQGDPGTEDNKYGFEGGRAFKYKGEYHLFTAERAGDPIIVKMRLAHWKSKDGIEWQRLSTLYESSGEFEGKDPRAALWAPMPYYNEKEERWNLFYVAYRSKPNDDTGWYLGYEGRIWWAVSKTPGYGGLYGPYEDVGIILEPGPDSDPWEGLQGTDSFYAYQVDDEWYGFYGSAQTQKDRNPAYPKWCVGLVKAPEMAGPWKRCSEMNPVRLHPEFAENPIVTKLEDGRYIAVFDGGTSKEFGYSVSDDGIHWSEAAFIDLTKEIDQWWTVMRTPLGLIPEEDGTFTVFFTALTKTKFACVGMVKLKESST